MFLCAAAQKDSKPTPQQTRRIVIATNKLFDGRGYVLPQTRIVIEDSKIVAIDPKASPIDYDLRGLTVMPGWIDAHVHITWSFGPDGKNEGADATTQFAAYQSAANRGPRSWPGSPPCRALVRPWTCRFVMRSRKARCPVRASSLRFSPLKDKARKRARPIRFVSSFANRKPPARISSKSLLQNRSAKVAA